MSNPLNRRLLCERIALTLPGQRVWVMAEDLRLDRLVSVHVLYNCPDCGAQFGGTSTIPPPVVDDPEQHREVCEFIDEMIERTHP